MALHSLRSAAEAEQVNHLGELQEECLVVAVVVFGLEEGHSDSCRWAVQNLQAFVASPVAPLEVRLYQESQRGEQFQSEW